MVAVVASSTALVQGPYCYRVFKVPVPVRDTHVVLGQLVLFVSRLAFIIASALFSLVLFRHLPEIDFGRNGSGFVWRGLLLLAVLFSVFCFTTELERLGLALRGQERTPDSDDRVRYGNR
ncbi:UNVERIFIED_ORG: hypothetical protein GGI57_004011 [Rhizobium aethiopicum]